jgi:hypothetical protein
MLIFVDEEYGWKYHRWDYPGTSEDLREDWKAGRIPPGLGYVRSEPGFRGTIEEIEPMGEFWARLEIETAGMSDDEADAFMAANEERIMEGLGGEWARFLAGFGAQADIHEEDDSALSIGDEVLPWPFQRDDDAMVAARRENPLPKERP